MQKQSQHQNIHMHSVELDDLLKLEVEAARDKLDDQLKPCADKLDAGASADKLEVEASSERDDEFKPSLFRMCTSRVQVGASTDKLEVKASVERVEPVEPTSVESFEGVQGIRERDEETAFKRHKRNDEDVVQCGIDFVCHENLNVLSSDAPVVDNIGSMPYIS